MGDNTDVAGFLANMDESASGLGGASEVSRGHRRGGAARAIVYALITRGFERIAVSTGRKPGPKRWPRILVVRQ